MKRQAVNPYLPSWEHVPDGEPHVFGDRLYIYGSHDRSHGTTFCMEDYVCWSAPADDLSDWRCEGVIWEKTDDSENRNPIGYMYAPDVAQGPDGRFYLYYFCVNNGKRPYSIKVAVCDEPAGKYWYYGEVKLKETEKYLPFDPAVLVDDDGRIWLYYGSAMQMGKSVFKVQGGAVVELAKDMKTVISGPKLTVPNGMHQKGTGFEGHAFFEASSMRKVNSKYYFIYSSMLSHELCYAVSDHPDGPFVYGGTIISNGDVGLNGRAKKDAVAPIGNNHGSIVQVGSQWYVFYHRHTQLTSYSRQGCAEKITILPDGRIPQVEVTSCGLNNGPLKAEGYYPMDICCLLIGGKLCIDEELCMGKPVSFLANMSRGATAGIRYFDFSGKTKLCIHWRASLRTAGMMERMTPYLCKVKGKLEIFSDLSGAPLASIPLESTAGDWERGSCEFRLTGTYPLYFRCTGKGAIDIRDIFFESSL